MPKDLKEPTTGTPTTVEVEKLVYGGEGLGRVEGQVVLVPYVLPSELVQVRTTRVKTGLLRGNAPEVLHSAPARIVPRCEYFAHCGGCHYQHADYQTQLDAKQSIFKETLKRLGDIHFDDEMRVVSGEPWNYRNRIQLHFADRRMGFHKAGSHDIWPIDHCYISSPTLNGVIQKLAQAVEQPEWPRFLRSLEVFSNESEVQLNIVDSTKPVAKRFFEWCGEFLPNLASGAITYRAAGHVFSIGRGSFFQVNRYLIDALVQEVVAGSQGKSAVDLYAGVGLFSLPLANRFDSVQAVERGGSASRDLMENVDKSGTNVQAFKQTTEEFLRSLRDSPDLLVADPPRAGLGKQATEELLRLRVPEVVIVSCDPTTLARDLRTLSSGYRIEGLTLVDLFPQTYHFEVVARLKLL